MMALSVNREIAFDPCWRNNAWPCDGGDEGGRRAMAASRDVHFSPGGVLWRLATVCLPPARNAS